MAILFFAASLTPSLIPRSYVFQGVVSGLSLVSGYAIGAFGQFLWHFLELPRPSARLGRRLGQVGLAVALAVALVVLWRASEWQDATRRIMGLPEVSDISPFTITAMAIVTFGVCLLVGRLFLRTMRVLARWLERLLPPRVSILLAAAAAVFLFWGIFSRVFVDWALRTADSISAEVDARIPPDMERPSDPQRTGSSASLIAWQDLGLAGRRFVASGPRAADIEPFHGGTVREPIRVYVGLNAAESAEARARLALRELQRVGAFDRGYLIVATPTGTGWVDAAGIDPLEYLLRGDVATVAMQYSYLPSIIALPTEGAYGVESARALFHAVYGYWTTLPRDHRPALYLYGLSLGALNSDLSFDFHDVIADPFKGALWTGPPFRAEHWQTITADRERGSPVWHPRFNGGKVVRFMTQKGGLERGDGPWGPFRIAYLQYASDPITFFTIDSLYREPAWMREPRGFDVSPSLRWFPIVTSLQLLADMAVSNSTPPGFGHVFAASHYIDAWVALLEPPGWSPDDVSRLKAKFAGR